MNFLVDQFLKTSALVSNKLDYRADKMAVPAGRDLLPSPLIAREKIQKVVF